MAWRGPGVAATGRRRAVPRGLLLVLLEMYGVGYPVLGNAVSGLYARRVSAGVSRGQGVGDLQSDDRDRRFW